MAKNDSSKSKAELYREERKARIAKAAKRNSKGGEMRNKASKIAKRVVAIVVVAAIVCGIGWVLIDNFGVIDKCTTAVTVGKEKVSTSDFNYYYTMQYQQTNYMSQYYSENYGFSMGYDTSKAPDDQKTTDADGNEITWSEKFRTSAIEQTQYLLANYNEAIKAGYELTEDEKAEINETIENYRSNAETNHYSLSAYLRATFGGGFNEKSFRKQLEMETITQRFVEAKKAELLEGVTDEEIKAEYDANRKNYDYVDVTYFAVPYTTLNAKDGESEEDLANRQKATNETTKKKIQEIYDGLTDLASLKAAAKAYKEEGVDNPTEAEYTTESKHAQFSTLSSAITEDGANWAYDTARKAGDKAIFSNDSGSYIVFIDKPIYSMNSVSVRHCLVNFNAEDSENVTDEEKKAAYDKADKLLQEWLKGDKSEDSFATMATENSEDTGSQETGGLYENIRISDNYVDSFKDWSFNPERKVGDTGIIESTYGYHIMYFVSNNTDDVDWKDTIRTEKGDTAYDTFSEALIAEDGEYPVTSSDRWTKYVAKQFCDKMKRNIAMNSGS
ncbi:MAG: peptidylprolyl isomerase [Clostridia bacterium]|nr:peptidylprolyl isomerase [Clostridia bacterium]